MPTELFGIVAPIFACAALGAGWARAGGPYDVDQITTLIMNIGAPCLVFASLASLEVDASSVARMTGAALASHLAFALLGGAALVAARLPPRTFLSPMVFANAGNMGMSVCLFAFGREGLALAACYFAVAALLQFTVGLAFWSGQATLRRVATTPVAHAALLGGVVLALEWRVPRVVLDTAGLLGQLTIPLMLLSLGASLARLPVIRAPRIVLLSLLRLAMGPAVGFGLSTLLGVTGVERGVLVIECAMPVAVFNYLLAQRYGRAPQEIASLVLLSTLLSVVTTPLWLALLL